MTDAQLHVLYRSYGGENSKRRPLWYGKSVALLSMLLAADHCPASVSMSFVNDGPLPAHLTEAMAEHGSVRRINAGSNRGSFIKTVSMAAQAGQSAGDWVWLAEDDYLYRPEAFAALVQLPPETADYATFAANPTAGTRDVDLAAAGHDRWFDATSTTSTFGLRFGALQQDRLILQLAPWSGGSWDHTTSLALNGVRPFPLRELFTDLLGGGRPPLGRRIVKVVGRPMGRLAMDVCALRPASRRRQLMVPWPNLAAHMERSELPTGTDWEQLALDTVNWGLRQSGATAALARHAESESRLGHESP